MKFSLATFALLLAFVVGCGGNSDQPKTGVTKGKVNLDGKPLESGKIVFDEGPSVPAIELEIKNGVYEGPVTIGKKTVRITALKAVKAPPGMAGQPGYEDGVMQNYLPSRYNTDSKEVREIKEGPNEFDFEVKAK